MGIFCARPYSPKAGLITGYIHHVGTPQGQPSSDDHPSKSEVEDGKKCNDQEK